MARYAYNDELANLEYGHGWSGQFDPDTNSFTYYDDKGRTKEQVLEEYQEHASRLNAISSVYQRADRIITGQDIEVSVVNNPDMEAPAQSNGKEIQFNANVIEELDSDSILGLHGINYHEVAHVLFSPRAGSNLGQYVKENKYVRALNILEEGRAEALLTAKYPSTKLFLEASTTDYLLKGDSRAWGDHFYLTTGRKYLPLELRQLIADKFIAQNGVALAEELHYLIHEYRGLVFPTDFDRAKELVKRMADIVGVDDNPTGQGNDPHPDGDMHTKGRPEGAKEQERLQSKNRLEQDNVEDLSQPIGAGMGAGGALDSDFNSEEKEFTEEDKAIREKLNKRMEDIKNNDNIKREVNETRKAIVNSDEMRTAMRNLNGAIDKTPSATGANLARKFATQLERIVTDSESKWDKFNPSGKLNVSRTMNPDVNAIGQMFDTWDTGNPNTDIEAVILMDSSSSMGGMMSAVSENSWIIKRGIEHIDGDVTVFQFNHESRVLYEKHEKAKPNTYRYVQANGNTNPIRALIESERLLTTSKKSIKLAFIVTDGTWEMTEECDSIIKRMNNKGVLTCVVFLGNYNGYKELVEASSNGEERATNYLREIRHGARVFHAVSAPKDVLNVATALVKETLK